MWAITRRLTGARVLVGADHDAVFVAKVAYPGRWEDATDVPAHSARVPLMPAKNVGPSSTSCGPALRLRL